MSKKYNVLIVDDHQIVIDGLRSILNKSDFSNITEASNGQEAWDIIKNSSTPFDLVLTDISMPLLSGIELCKLIKEGFPAIKVLILSMYDSASVIREALVAEADGFALKNVSKEELLRGLQKVVNDGCYYSKEIVPILKSEKANNEKKKEFVEQLTKREIEILSLVLNEHTTKRIAEKLFLSEKTVDNHRANILKKTGCTNTVGLIKYAIKIGLE